MAGLTGEGVEAKAGGGPGEQGGGNGQEEKMAGEFKVWELEAGEFVGTK